MFSFSKYVFIMPAIMTWTHLHTDIPVHHRKIIKSSFCHYTIKNVIDVFIDFQMISPSGFNGDISSPVASRWQRHHTAPLVSSGPTLCVYELVCYRGEKLEASIVPAATKPDMKHSPQTPVRFTPPPLHPPLTSMGEERREAEKLQLGNKGWQETPPHPSSSSTLSRQSTGPRALLCSLSGSYMPAGGNTHIYSIHVFV